MLNQKSPIFWLSLTCCGQLVPSLALADFQKHTSENAMVHWAAQSVRLPVDPNLEKVFGPEVYDAIAAAADAWALGADVPSIELDYEPLAHEREAAIAGDGNWIGVLEDWPFGDQLAVTVSRVNASTGEYAATQVWINASHPFALAENLPSNVYDLRGVITHEFGHVLGLGEFDHVPEATMYPDFRRGETHQRTLSAMDRDTVRGIYEAYPPGEASPSGCSIAPSERAAMPASVFALALGFIALFHKRDKSLRGARRLRAFARTNLHQWGISGARRGGLHSAPPWPWEAHETLVDDAEVRAPGHRTPARVSRIAHRNFPGSLIHVAIPQARSLATRASRIRRS